MDFPELVLADFSQKMAQVPFADKGMTQSEMALFARTTARLLATAALATVAMLVALGGLALLVRRTALRDGPKTKAQRKAEAKAEEEAAEMLLEAYWAMLDHAAERVSVRQQIDQDKRDTAEQLRQQAEAEAFREKTAASAAAALVPDALKAKKKLQRCSKCKAVQYCGRECQVRCSLTFSLSFSLVSPLYGHAQEARFGLFLLTFDSLVWTHSSRTGPATRSSVRLKVYSRSISAPF
jgi:hypothetical protein